MVHVLITNIFSTPAQFQLHLLSGSRPVQGEGVSTFNTVRRGCLEGLQGAWGLVLTKNEYISDELDLSS